MNKEYRAKDAEGNEFIIVESGDSVNTSSFNSTNEKRARIYHLTDGTEVDRVSDTEFMIAQSGKRLFIL